MRRGTVRSLRVIEEVTWLVDRETVMDNRGQILDRIAGVGKEEAIKFVTLSLQNQL
jgi:hypothetical protein